MSANKTVLTSGNERTYGFECSVYDDEYWWGGCIHGSEKMPLDKNSVYSKDLLKERITQTVPLFLSSKGRVIWSEEPYCISFDRGTITAKGETEILLRDAGKTLRDAYLYAMNNFFPFEKNIHTPREFYKNPMFNTWMEFVRNQREDKILKYAEEIVENGYTPGILIIDGGWQKAPGYWDFNPEKFPSPKEMVKKLHEMGFTVMLWVTPFVSADCEPFRDSYDKKSSESLVSGPNREHFLRVDNGELSIQHWWGGFSAVLNMNLESDREYLDKQLGRLMDEFGIDGFKFDGWAFRPNGFLNGKTICGGYTHSELNRAWIQYGSKYRLHEFKDTWKYGGKPIIQRLFDKSHKWEGNGIDCIIPNGIFAGLIGSPFLCPDMVGGGEWTAFVYGKHEEQLFVRMAQCSALFPMMQFSSLPWRHLSPEGSRLCLEAAKLHERMYPEIDAIVSETEKTGEPIIRSMEYQFPSNGYEKINDQFLLGDSILVAPVVKKDQYKKKVVFPEGEWRDEQGRIYTGKSVVEVDAPIDTLPWFRRIK